MKAKITLSIILLISILCLKAQSTIKLDTLNKQILTQINLLPQEKLFIHTDRESYFSTDTIWMAPYLINANSHLPTFGTNYIYIELINPFGQIMNRIKIPRTEEYFAGYIPLGKDTPEGWYQLRGYSQYMTNFDETYFFNKSIYITSPYSFAAPMNIQQTEEKNSNLIKIKINTNSQTNKDHPLPKLETIDQNGETITTKEIAPNHFAYSTYKNKYTTLFKYGNYERFIETEPSKKDFHVDFFPEGGYIIPNQTTKIAFKALNNKGTSEDIEGIIINSKGDTLQSFQSQHLGMGLISLIADNKENYTAICSNKAGATKHFALPTPNPNAITLKTNKMPEQKIALSINHNLKKLPQLYILIHQYGKILYSENWNPKQDFILIDKRLFPFGISQILLLDELLNPLSERLIFCQSKPIPLIDLKVTQSTEQLDKNKQVKLSIKTQNENDINSHISISITDDRYNETSTTNSIYSYLLLTSELKGHIEEADSYFNHPDSDTSLDILMTTQGWRRYNIPNALKGKYTYPHYGVEQTQSIEGNIKNIITGAPQVNATVSLLPMQDSIPPLTTYSDKNGRFKFDNLNHPDNTLYIVNASSQKGSETIELSIDKQNFPSFNNKLPINANRPKHSTNTESTNIKTLLRSANLDTNDWKITLKEITVSASKATNQKLKPVHIASTVIDSKRLESLKAIQNTKTLLNITLPLRMRRNTESTNIGGGKENINADLEELPIEYYIDGSRVDNMFVFGGTLLPEEIEQIEAVPFPISYAYGVKASNGVVFITTKTFAGTRENNTKAKLNLKQITPLSYQTPAEFYNPPFNNLNDPIKQRATVYWNPRLNINKHGSTILFYPNKEKSNYTIVIQGLTSNGEIIYKTMQIKQ